MEEKPAELPVSEQEVQIQAPVPLAEASSEGGSFLDKIKIHKFKILIGVLGIFVLAGAIFGAYKLSQKQIQPVSQPTPTPVVVATPTPDPTANWKTYTNTKYGYSVKYPTTWFVNFDSPGSQQFSNIKSEYPSDTRVRVDVNHVSREYFDERYSSEVGTKWEAEFKVMEEKIANLTVADKPAVKLIRIPSEGATSPVYITRILLAKDSDVFEISNWGKNKEDQQKYDVVFNLMLSTFKFLEEAEGWETYTSSQYSFSFKYPTDWDVRDLLSVNKTLPGRENTLVFIGFGPKHIREDVYGMIEITKNDLDYEIAQFKKSFETAGIPTIIKQENTIDISGKTGKEIITQNTLNKVESKNWFVSYKGLSYKISGGGTRDNSIVYKLLSTFRFLE